MALYAGCGAFYGPCPLCLAQRAVLKEDLSENLPEEPLPQQKMDASRTTPAQLTNPAANRTTPPPQLTSPSASQSKLCLDSSVDSDEDSEGQMDVACEGQGQRLLELQGLQLALEQAACCNFVAQDV